MYSPVPIENAPATSAAAPVSTTVCADTPPPPRPEISDALVTSPSTAPNTVGRSQPPETSRCPCDHPARNAAAPVASDGPLALSPATCHALSPPSPGPRPRGRLVPPQPPGAIPRQRAYIPGRGRLRDDAGKVRRSQLRADRIAPTAGGSG